MSLKKFGPYTVDEKGEIADGNGELISDALSDAYDLEYRAGRLGDAEDLRKAHRYAEGKRAKSSEPKKGVYYGWFSEKMEAVAGACLYRSVDGGEVKITCVSKTKNHSLKHDDVKFVGMVDKFIRRVSQGRHGFSIFPGDSLW